MHGEHTCTVGGIVCGAGDMGRLTFFFIDYECDVLHISYQEKLGNIHLRQGYTFCVTHFTCRS